MADDVGATRLPRQNSSLAFVGWWNLVSCCGTQISDSLILQVLGLESKGLLPQDIVNMGLTPTAQSNPSCLA